MRGQFHDVSASRRISFGNFSDVIRIVACAKKVLCQRALFLLTLVAGDRSKNHRFFF